MYSFWQVFKGEWARAWYSYLAFHWGDWKKSFSMLCFTAWTSNIIEWMYVFESNTHCCFSIEYWRNWWNAHILEWLIYFSDFNNQMDQGQPSSSKRVLNSIQERDEIGSQRTQDDYSPPQDVDSVRNEIIIRKIGSSSERRNLSPESTFYQSALPKHQNPP